MTDYQDLKDRLDLAAELEKDLGPGHKSGRWIMFSCPFPEHGGHTGKNTPSLGATPGNGRFYCFACGKSGDLITWLHEYRGMSWAEINDLAGSGALPPPRPRSPAELQPDPSGPPSPEWQARAASFLAACQDSLWGPGGVKAREYLHGRGLSDDFIHRYCLGFNPGDSCDPFEAWGLQPDPSRRGVWLPRGIVIPYLVGGDYWALNIRRPVGEPKYLKVTGSQSALFGAGNLAGAELVLMTEGEFDAILADQLIGDVAGVASLGSASKKLDVAAWGPYLLPARAILAAYDLDPAGQRGMTDLLKKSAQIHPVRVPALRPGDKDITDYWRAGGDLWEWFKYNLDRLGLLPSVDSVGLTQGA